MESSANTYDDNHPMVRWYNNTALITDKFTILYFVANALPAMWFATHHGMSWRGATFFVFVAYGFVFAIMREAPRRWLTTMIINVAIFPIGFALSLIGGHDLLHRWLAQVDAAGFTIVAFASAITLAIARRKARHYMAS
jgi:hypothetical protein